MVKMTEESHKKEWESMAKEYSVLMVTTGLDIYKQRYEACKRLLGEDQVKKPDLAFFK